MANRDKRSRALLRNLRKQARKGTLSAREQDTLLNQEKKFRKARRRRRRGIGAGLGAALGAGVGAYLASPAFASLIESGASAAALKRAAKAQGASEEEAAKIEKAVESAPEGAPTEEVIKEVEEQVAPVSDAAEDLAMELEDRAEILDDKGIRGEVAGDEELIRGLEAIEEEEEAGIDDDLARASLSEQLQGLSDFPGERVAMGEAAPLRPIGPGVVDQDNPYMDQGGLRDIDPRTEQRLAAARESMRLRDNERSSDNMRERAETLERLRREGGFDPFTGEYVDSDRQKRIDAEFDEDFERSAFTDAERAAERENARLDRLDEMAKLDAQMNALPVPNEGDFEFGESEELGQRPALTGPNNPLSRRVNVDDPGLRLPIEDIPMEAEDLYDPQEASDLARYRLDQMLGAGPLARRRARRIFNEQNEMARAEQNRRSGGSGIPVRQQMGGKNPKMADLMKKVKAKYGIR